MKIIMFLVLLFFVYTMLYSTTINIPGDQPTIQAGIDVAEDNDVVLVQPGTYLENINFNGKAITVASLYFTTQDTNYISTTIIDGDSLNSVVKFENGEDSLSVLTGFTITNGYFYYGGGISCIGSPTLENLIISGNRANYGGGIFCHKIAEPIISKSIIINNNADEYGGGMYSFEGGNPIILNSIIEDNTAEEGAGL